MTPGFNSTDAELALLDPTIDPSTMAKSTLVLALRKQRRDLKRLERSETRRSNLRASTLKTDAEIEAREKEEKTIVHRKGRVAMHKGGEARGVRNYTQAELIAEALEEEERNKEELQKWLRREEERRELRRVGRKRVRGPRWTWISRTVGKMVEVVEDGVKEVEVRQARDKEDVDDEAGPGVSTTVQAGPAATLPTPAPDETKAEQPVSQGPTVALEAPIPEAPIPVSETPNSPPALASPQPPNEPENAVASSSKLEPPHTASNPPALPTTSTPVQPEPSQYTRNYLILSQIPGGLPAELSLVLGSHVDWSDVQYIPARNRPVVRRPPRCPFTGKKAKYRHPTTMIPYADVSGYKEIEALLQNRYVWSEGGFWAGGEEDMGATEAEEVEGWREACHGGWIGGSPVDLGGEEEGGMVMAEEEVVAEPVKKGRKRASEVVGGQAASKGKKRVRKSAV